MAKTSIVDDELKENHGQDGEPDVDEALDEFEPEFEVEADPELELRDIHEIDEDLETLGGG
jgi:hypothetical protein